MRLERFQLKGFAQHQYIDLQFRERVPNVIIGPNEAGKSTLMNGLLGTLFGVSNHQPYVPWHDDPIMTGWLRFDADGEIVELERRFQDQQVKVWVNGHRVYQGRGLVTGRASEDERYRALLHDWIGFAEPEVFQRTVFVAQDLVEDQSLSSFSSQIKRLISGTREANYETAIDDLHEALRDLRLTGRDRNPRRLEQLRGKLIDLEVRHSEAAAVQQKVVTLIEEENRLQEQIATADETHERYSTLVARYADYQRLDREEQQARQHWTELENRLNELKASQDRRAELIQKRDELRIPGDPTPDEINQLIRDIERNKTLIESLQRDNARDEEVRARRKKLEETLAELEIPGNPKAADIQQLSWQIQRLEQRVEELRNLIDQLPATSEPDPAKKSADSLGASWLRSVAIGLATAIMFASVILGVVLDPLLFLGVILGAVILAVPFLLSLLGDTSADDAESEVSTERAQYEKEIAEAQEELNGLTVQRDQYTQTTGLSSLDEISQRAEQYERTRLTLDAQPEPDGESSQQLTQARHDLAKLAVRRNELVHASGEPDLDHLVRRASEYASTISMLQQVEPIEYLVVRQIEERVTKARQNAGIAQDRMEKLLEDHPGLDQIPAADVAQYRRLVDGAEAERKKAEHRLREVRFERQQLGRGSDDAEALRLEVDELNSEIDRVELLADAHDLAIEMLRHSVSDFQENALNPVAEDATRYFNSITSGRYHDVEIGRDTMAPVVSGDGRASIEFDRLSRGARDQLYLSIRAALVDALSGDRHLPLVLDDPCVHFDQERLEATAELIGELAQERQILLFTKDETWTQWFVPVLRLERRDSVVS